MFNIFFSGSSNYSFFFLKFLNNKFFIIFLFSGSDILINFNILKLFCIKNKILFFQIKNFYFYNNFFLYNIYYFIKLRKINFNCSFLFDYGFIYSLKIIRLPFYFFLNLHFSFFPLFKGFNPINLILENDFFLLGFNFIFINKFLDLGNIFFYLKSYFSTNFFVLIKKFFYFLLYKFLNFIFIIFKFYYFFNFKQIKNLNIFFTKKVR